MKFDINNVIIEYLDYQKSPWLSLLISGKLGLIPGPGRLATLPVDDF